ncbi:hypothetical protein DCAR_0934756 [Daucus carota subsp. sativus]|uniref:Protein kinase domain-containing protein n=1 Tax=Daucus carota subsp. sativus TaxID=79200 RepID=A0AAF0XYG3_DAUCS|nr:hypothetical protein DCAR_0934756 [Daucus carota subsp. sativus]
MAFQVSVYLSWVILVFTIRVVTAEGEECRMTRCSHHGPEIRFPFWLKEKQPEHCGYPGFRVSCHRGKTLLHFQYLADTSLQGIQILLSKEVPVRGIQYASQIINFDTSYYSTNNLKFVSKSTLSPSEKTPLPFQERDPQYYPDKDSTSFVSCDSRIKGESKVSSESISPAILATLSGQSFPVYYFSYYENTASPSINSCSRVFNSSIPYQYLSGYFYLQWSTPDCKTCEAKGEHCKLKKDNTTSNNKTANHSTICLSRGISVITSIIPGGTLIVIVLIALLYYIIRSYRQKKYDKLKIEMFLTDYKAMKPTRYSYSDIKKITSQFSDKLGQGGYGSVYRGQITNDIVVAVKVLNCDPKANGEDFINEVGTIGRIYHVNVVRLVGYCADGCNRALVYEFQPNNSLEKFTYSGKYHQNNFLGWEKMQEIALGIAKGIEYLHEGCAQQILHFDIKPHNILLDQNFCPKISDFGLAKLCSKDQSIVSMTMARGTIGYIAPEVFSRNFGKVSSKSDVYSFGMLLLEMVGARNNSTAEDNSESYFPEWIFHRLEGGEVAIQVEKEEDSNIAKKLTVIGLWCIGWHPVDRPSMKHVIHMLESEECPKMPPNPFRSSNVHSFTNVLEVISESE